MMRRAGLGSSFLGRRGERLGLAVEEDERLGLWLVQSIFNCTAVSKGVPSWTCKDQLRCTVCESSVASSTGKGVGGGVFNCTAVSRGVPS
jgi:hypothetical protein